LLRYYSTILEMLKASEGNSEQFGLRIGAKTNNGLGKIFLIYKKLYDYDFTVYDYDFTDYKNVILWFKENQEGNKEKPAAVNIKNIVPFKRNKNDLIMDVYLVSRHL